MREIVLAVVTLVLAGCSSPPQDIGPPSSMSSMRPQEIKLDRVDPCGLMPDDSARLAGFNSGPKAERHPSFQSSSCHFYSPNGTELTVTAVPSQGIERFEPSKKTGEARSRKVQGFRALEIHSPASCVIVVDVADSQVLHVAFSKKSSLPLTEQTMCQMAIELANVATRTLAR